MRVRQRSLRRRLVSEARHHVLQYEFKRKHNLTQVGKFDFLQYLSRALKKDMVRLVQPSHATWGIICAFHLLCIACDGSNATHATFPSLGDSRFGPAPIRMSAIWTVIAIAWVRGCVRLRAACDCVIAIA